METISITARLRHLSGSDIANKVRRANLLPAVLYGKGMETRAIALEPKPIKRGLQSAWGRNALFQVTIAGEPERLAICKDVQIHPTTRTLRHVDLQVLQPDSRIVVTVPVTLTGRSLGQKAGGRLEFINRYVKLACTPATLPKVIDIDVTPFDNGTGLSVEQLTLPEGVTPVFKKSFKIFEVQVAKAELPTAAEAGAPVAAAADPAAAAAADKAKPKK